MATLAWRKSSYSGNGANCVDVAPAAEGVLLRDTKDRGKGPVIAFTPDQWTAFLAEVTAGVPSTNGAVDVIPSASGVQVRALASGISLSFTLSEWTAFRAGVQDGEFDPLALA
jgi:L-aminopeptidase/D-esterase-like protein